jgi:hypothetical protein
MEHAELERHRPFSFSRRHTLRSNTRRYQSRRGLSQQWLMPNVGSSVSTINDRVWGGRYRDERLELHLALHSAELVKMKIYSLKQFSASIAHKPH